MPVLEARELVKAVGAGRGRRIILDRVSLQVERGELVAVLGRSGSGKSTLLNLLGALDRPDSGELLIAGEPVAGAGPAALARTRLRHIGFIFQSFHLIEEMTGAENVLLPARLPGAAPGAVMRGHRLIEELGLGDVQHNLPHELSGGEQQRFAVARALVNDPDVVLADEPTGNLDPENAGGVLALLRRLSGSGGAHAVVMVTHDAEAAGAADRILRLVDGRLSADRLAVR